MRPISPALADAIRAACTRTGALLIADEVQSGSCRTGTFLASPDVRAHAGSRRARQGARRRCADRRSDDQRGCRRCGGAGDHGTTYGGNLLACRAALIFLDTVEGGLLDALVQTSEHLFAGLRALAAEHPKVVTAVRGAGLIAGLELASDASPVVNAALERGLLVNRTSTTVVRMLAALHRHASESGRGARDSQRRAECVNAEELGKSKHSGSAHRGDPRVTDFVLRQALPEDAEALFALISAHQREGHLLPRTLEDLRRHAGRFVVCDVSGELKACGGAGAAVQDGRRSAVARRRRGFPPRRAGRAARRSTCAIAPRPRASKRCAPSRTTRGSSSVRTSPSCRTCRCRKRSPPTASAARCSARAGSTR